MTPADRKVGRVAFRPQELRLRSVEGRSSHAGEEQRLGIDQVVLELRTKGHTTVPTKSNDSGDIPPHGTLARVRQHIPADKRAGNALPDGSVEPVWLGGH